MYINESGLLSPSTHPQHRTVQCDMMQHNTVRCSTVPYCTEAQHSVDKRGGTMSGGRVEGRIASNSSFGFNDLLKSTKYKGKAM
jgi:hypothetical protein